MKIKNEHINIKNIKRIKKGNYEHTRSKDGYVTGSSIIYAIYVDFGNGYKEINWFYNQEERNQLYNKLIRSIENITVNNQFRYYENKKILLIVERKEENEEFKTYIGTLFWISNGKFENDGLNKVKEYKNKDVVDFTPYQNESVK